MCNNNGWGLLSGEQAQKENEERIDKNFEASDY